MCVAMVIMTCMCTQYSSIHWQNFHHINMCNHSDIVQCTQHRIQGSSATHLYLITLLEAVPHVCCHGECRKCTHTCMLPWWPFMYVAMVTIHMYVLVWWTHYVAMVNTMDYTAVTCRDKLGGCQNIIAVSLASSSSFDWLVGHLKVFVQILTLCWVGTLHEWLKEPTLWSNMGRDGFAIHRWWVLYHWNSSCLN